VELDRANGELSRLVEQQRSVREGAAAVPSAEPRARLRWIFGGEVHELSLEDEPGPRLIPMRHHGAILAALIVEACDQAAATGKTHLHVSREGLEVFVDIPATWPRPEGSPSNALGGDELAPVEERQVLRMGDLGQRYERALASIGPGGVNLLRDYPRRRRALGAARVRLEAQALRCDDLVQRRRRSRWTGVAGVVLGLGAVAWGALFGISALFAAGAALFCLAAAGIAVLSWRDPRLVAQRQRLEDKLGRACLKAADLDETVRRLAARTSYGDPFEASAAFHAEAERREALSSEHIDESAWLERTRALAQRAGLDAGVLTLEELRASPRPRGRRGWPVEVSSCREGLAPRAVTMRAARRELIAALASTARLLLRIEEELPQSWPVILWDPWADRPADERARLLVALANALAPRALVSIVSSG